MVDETQGQAATPPKERTLVAQGKYKGKIIGYAMQQTAKGLLRPAIKFEIEVGEAKEHMFWAGSLNEGTARNITIEALLVCGLKGSDISKMADGPSSGLLDMTKEVLLTVGIEPDQTDPNKKYNRVEWINELGGANFKNTIDKATAVQKCAGLNLGADIMRIRQEKGYKSDAAAPAPAAAGKLSADDIPF